MPASESDFGGLIGPDFIVKSPGPNLEAVVGVTVPEFVWKDLHLKKNAPALECAETGRILTHDDVYRQSRSFATALIKLGIKRKDVIALVLPNMPEFGVALFGILEAGGIATPTNPTYTKGELARHFILSEAKMIVTTQQFLPTILQGKPSCPQLKWIVNIGDPTEGCLSYADMITTDSAGTKFLKGSEIDTQDEVAVLPFSSGTIGLPKGVELTHSNMCSKLGQSGTLEYVLSKRLSDKADRIMLVLPFFHVYGLNVLLTNQYLGTHMLCVPKFGPDTFPEYIKRFQPTILPLVPPLISFLANTSKLTTKDFESVECVQSGAGSLSVAIREKFLKKVEKVFIFQNMYGLTESSPTAMASGSISEERPGYIGKLVPGSLGKVIDVITGECLEPRMAGEICIKGPQIMRGYFRNEEATKNTIDSEGWFHTGDLGYYDEEGGFYIVDRLKELIKVKGMQVAPAELEDELSKILEVIDVAVIGIPDDRAGELPRAYIVRKSEALTESKINEFLNGRISLHKQLKGGIEFVDAIPRANSGKILRKELKAEYLSKHGDAK